MLITEDVLVAVAEVVPGNGMRVEVGIADVGWYVILESWSGVELEVLNVDNSMMLEVGPSDCVNKKLGVVLLVLIEI